MDSLLRNKTSIPEALPFQLLAAGCAVASWVFCIPALELGLLGDGMGTMKHGTFTFWACYGTPFALKLRFIQHTPVP